MEELLSIFVILGIILFIILCILGTCWVVRRRNDRSHPHLDMSFPLPLLSTEQVEARSHQLQSIHDHESYMTDYQDRHWKCELCEFTNVKSITKCTLCGADSSLGHVPEEVESFMIQSTLRQKAAKRRNEWVRRSSYDGVYRWEKYNHEFSSPNVNSGDTLSVKSMGLVARLKLNDSFLSSTDSTDNQYALHLVDCTTGDAADAFNGYKIDLDDLKILEEVRELDFPTKYAWFRTQMKELMQPWVEGCLKLRVHRENVVAESIEQLLAIEMHQIHLPLRLEFIGEDAVDAGGVVREWFSLLAEALFSEELGLFECCHRELKTYTIYPYSGSVVPDHFLYFRAIGRLMGRALLEGHLLDAHLCMPLFKHILGMPSSFADVEYVNPDVYQSMSYIRTHDNIHELDLDFCVLEPRRNDIPEQIELKPNGKDILLTDDNKEEYFQLRLHYMLLGRCHRQLKHMLIGLFEVVPQELLMIFDAFELELVLCGVPRIDLQDWKSHTVILDDPNQQQTCRQVVAWFWDCVQAMTNDQQARLIQFATGSCQVPVHGFQTLTSYDGQICWFTLKCLPTTQLQYPRAFTCFNRIDLPIYSSQEQLHEALEMIVKMDVMGFSHM